MTVKDVNGKEWTPKITFGRVKPIAKLSGIDLMSPKCGELFARGALDGHEITWIANCVDAAKAGLSRADFMETDLFDSFDIAVASIGELNRFFQGDRAAAEPIAAAVNGGDGKTSTGSRPLDAANDTGECV